ncbi:YncE family protein [Pseudaestuariivita rosea]|uniref:YncE family protein n=1 Tax=Pseudaestuariivita rosea TaxID=2763263 RepID=UPI001ABA7F8B|nr:hypothetical protein [Pseudaestuariivita rosea]
MKQILTTVAALCLAAPAFADPDAKYRLIVADNEAPRITVIDTAGEGMTRTFDLASPARVYMGPDGRHAWALQRSAGQVQVIDTGLIEEDHGDHSALILETPAVLSPVATGDTPVHFNMGSDRVAVFWDGTGAATLHGPAGSGDLTPLATLDTGGPHHGVAVPVGDLTIVTVAPMGEGLPDALAVVDMNGTELSRIDCLNLHGEGKAGSFIAFGCEDGVAIFDTNATPPTSRFLPYPDDAPDGGMVRTLLSPANTLALIGNFGAEHIVIFDPSSETGDFSFTQLPAPRMSFALDDSGQVGFAMLADGRMIRFSALTGRILAEAAGVTEAYSMDRGVVRPMMDVAMDQVAVSDPAAGRVVLLDAQTLDPVVQLDVGGQPRSLILLAAEADHDH